VDLTATRPLYGLSATVLTAYQFSESISQMPATQSPENSATRNSPLSPREAATELLTRRAARKSLIAFTEYTYPQYRTSAHHERIAAELEAVMRGEVDRLMLCVPPRHGKSELASVRFPAWALGHDPRLQIVSASATAELATDFGRQVRNLMASQEYGNLFGTKSNLRESGAELSQDSQARGKFHTEAGGIFYAVGIGGALLGRGADIALVDDFFASFEDASSKLERDRAWNWFTGTLYNRLQPGGRIVIIGHRTSEDDPQGRLLAQQACGGDKWRVVEIAPQRASGRLTEAVWPERYPVDVLERIKANTLPQQWSALYMQNPTPDEGTYFLRAWLVPYVKPPTLIRCYGASDYAVTSDGGDWTVHMVVGIDSAGDMWLLDLWRGRTTSDVWVEALCDLVGQWRPLEWAEETGQISSAMGPLITRRMFERKTMTYRRRFASKHDKAVRAQSIRGRMAVRGLRVPMHAKWYADFENEILACWAGKHDDQADCLGLIGQLLDHILPAWKDIPKAKEPDPYLPVRGGVRVNFKAVLDRKMKAARDGR
jgi:predicted phage terminase large subunit-like protein